MKNILIFGANGLCGLYFTRYLSKEKYRIFASSRSDCYNKYFEQNNIPFFQVDITQKKDFDKLPKTGIDVVILLAAYLPANMQGYKPEKYFEVNTIGALNVLEYCKTSRVKQILYPQTHSDVAALWGTGIIEPYSVKKINYNNDHTVYAISKIAAEETIKHYHSMYGLSYCIFRCPNIYAWHPNSYYYLNGVKKEVAYRKLIKKAIKSEDIEIWGNCNIPRDMVYVKDFVQLIDKSIEKEINSAIYNVSTGVGTTLEEEIKTIVDIFSPSNKKSKIIYRPDIKIIEASHLYSIENAKKELGYKPKYFIKEMFEDMKKEMQMDYWNLL